MDEYINRKAAIDAYCILRCRTTRDPEICRNCDEPILAIPAADVVEVRHGRWELGGMFGDIGRCSNCHYMFPADTAMSEFHFCPNCGADMQEEECDY